MYKKYRWLGKDRRKGGKGKKVKNLSLPKKNQNILKNLNLHKKFLNLPNLYRKMQKMLPLVSSKKKSVIQLSISGMTFVLLQGVGKLLMGWL